MKNLFFFIAIICLTFFSCKKENTTTAAPISLDGKWRMVIVRDNISGLSTTKPPAIGRDVDITFTFTDATSGNISGLTTSNQLYPSGFSIGTNQSITIPGLFITKIGETIWGFEFVRNIINAYKYSFEEGGLLNINTTDKILIFQKQ